ncbi:MAG: hypothetical protein ACK4ME_08505 [Fimbriimonadales bacterium]
MNNTMESVLGILFLYLALAGVGLVDVALFRRLTADYITRFRHNERGVLARGLLTVLGALVLIILLNAVAQGSPPDTPTRVGMQLLSAVVSLLLLLAFLIGYGALAWRLGERVLLAFGVAEPAPGWCVLTANLVILSVVWIPVLGWALGLYWIMLAVGAVTQRLMGGEVEAVSGDS